MYLQELTAQVDEAIESGESFEDVTRYSETTVEARLIPAYREYIRQIESDPIVGGHITKGAVAVSAALNRAAKFTNRNQAFQFMRDIEQTGFER